VRLMSPRLATGVNFGAEGKRLKSGQEDALSALVNLGYQRAAAEKALASVSKNGKSDSFEGIFREALAVLSK